MYETFKSSIQYNKLFQNMLSQNKYFLKGMSKPKYPTYRNTILTPGGLMIPLTTVFYYHVMHTFQSDFTF